MCVSDAVNASNISTGFQIYEKGTNLTITSFMVNLRISGCLNSIPSSFLNFKMLQLFSNSFVLDGVTWWTEEENHWIYLLQVLAQVGR